MVEHSHMQVLQRCCALNFDQLLKQYRTAISYGSFMPCVERSRQLPFYMWSKVATWNMSRGIGLIYDGGMTASDEILVAMRPLQGTQRLTMITAWGQLVTGLVGVL